MPQHPTQREGQNQTLLELIYSLKGLAQTVEFFHQDLLRRMDEESRGRNRDLDSIERSLDKLETAISGIRESLHNHSAATIRAISQVEDIVEDNNGAPKEAISTQVTGKIEMTKDGHVRLELSQDWLKKIWYVILVAAAGGGIYGLKELIQSLIG